MPSAATRSPALSDRRRSVPCPECGAAFLVSAPPNARRQRSSSSARRARSAPKTGAPGSPSPPRSPRTCCRLPASPHDVVDTRSARASATASTCAECRRTCRPPALRYSREDATIASNAPPVSASAFAVFFSARASDVPFRVSDPFRGAPSPGLSTPFSTPSFVSFTLDAHAPSKSSAAEWKPVASPDPKLPALDDDASYGQSARGAGSRFVRARRQRRGSVTETRLRETRAGNASRSTTPRSRRVLPAPRRPRRPRRTDNQSPRRSSRREGGPGGPGRRGRFGPPPAPASAAPGPAARGELRSRFHDASPRTCHPGAPHRPVDLPLARPCHPPRRRAPRRAPRARARPRRRRRSARAPSGRARRRGAA